MTKMSKTQRAAALAADAYRGRNGNGYGRGIILAGDPTVNVMVRNGWARRSETDPTARPVVTRAGLIAAGVDMDALHAEALSEDMDRQNQRALDQARANFRDRDHAEALREAGVPLHDATDEFPCPECGHFGTGNVPGCTCAGCEI